MWRVVMRPLLLRPPLLVSGRTRDFSGVERVTSTKSATLDPRRPGVVGLYLRIPMVCPQLPQAPALPKMSIEPSRGVLAAADAEPRATGLALAVHGVDRVDLDAEDLLDGDLDLGLVRTRVHD